MVKYLTHLIFAACFVAIVAGALVIFVREMQAGGDQGIVIAAPPAQMNGDEPKEITVYITGEIISPGVYSIEDGARLDDLVHLAGGPTGDANLAAVNLALRLIDEDHWHIPGSSNPVETAQNSPGSPPSGAPTRIDINSAGVETLQQLPGIGEVKAQAIVRHREANGRFETADDLLEVTGIGESTLAGFRDLIVFR